MFSSSYHSHHTKNYQGLRINNISQKNYNSFQTKHVSASLLPSSVVNCKAIRSRLYTYLKCLLHGVMERLQK